MPEIDADVGRYARHRGNVYQAIQQIPLWLIVLLILTAVVVVSVVRSENYSEIASFISKGLSFTIRISVLGYALALVVGLIVGLGRVSKHPIIYTLATLYVEILRGVPILVVILYVAFVISPRVGVRSDIVRAIVALGLAYAAYLAEIYRAGIQAIPKGQLEAAYSLGMSRYQTMRHIVLPQAIRLILPPLGNDFIAILKDSSLATVISVPELTQQTRLYVSRTFDTFGGWTMAALLYLSMTLVLSLGVRVLERLSTYERR
ncbi:MAG: amino acid ABC transporter permease [Ardenticatenia bacterium]|nr:amino acid ABC transporter permease [Ardenticatenia bacterium]